MTLFEGPNGPIWAAPFFEMEWKMFAEQSARYLELCERKVAEYGPAEKLVPYTNMAVAYALLAQLKKSQMEEQSNEGT